MAPAPSLWPRRARNRSCLATCTPSSRPPCPRSGVRHALLLQMLHLSRSSGASKACIKCMFLCRLAVAMHLLQARSMLSCCAAGSNFERSGESEKSKSADFKKLGLTGYSGDKVVSQRDIQRLVSGCPFCLLAVAAFHAVPRAATATSCADLVLIGLFRLCSCRMRKSSRRRWRKRRPRPTSRHERGAALISCGRFYDGEERGEEHLALGAHAQEELRAGLWTCVVRSYIRTE